MPPPCRLLIVQRTADGQTRFSQDVGVNHGRGNVLMSQKLLDRTDVVATFKQMRGKTVPERVTTRGLGNASTPDRQFHRVLKIFLADMMTADLV